MADAATPIGKVVLLPSDLPTILSEGKSEWCEERSKTLGLVDRTGKDEVAKSLPTIESQTAVVASLNSKVEQLESVTSADELDLHVASEIRAKESSEFADLEMESTFLHIFAKFICTMKCAFF